MNLSELNLAEQLLTDYLDTCSWIEANSKPLNMTAFMNKSPECGTVCCIAGWMAVRSNGSEHNIHDIADAMSDRVTDTIRCALFPRFGAEKSFKYWVPLFGAHNGSGPAALGRQRKRAEWFLHRIQARLAYHAIERLTRQQRRLAQLHEQASSGNTSALRALVEA